MILPEKNLTVLLVGGNGGREEAIFLTLKKSSRVDRIYVSGRSDHLAELGAICLGIEDYEELADFAEEKGVNLTIVGPEKPLSAGIVDIFEGRGLNIIGPNKAASRLESSKCWAKEVMFDLGIPVAEFANFSDPDEARRHVCSVGYPVVVKADGLAAGKGSLVCSTVEEAEDAVNKLMEQRIFGDAGLKVDIERRLYGREMSFFCISDGYNVAPLEGVQDYKHARDFGRGKMTGGMGAYSPHLKLTPELQEIIMSRVANPLIKGLREKYGILYRGILYLGLMLVGEGADTIPYVLEINIRLGDPEAQVILPRLQNDFVDVCEAMLAGNLSQVQLEWDPRFHFILVVVSGKSRTSKGPCPGYPDRYAPGRKIYGLEKIKSPSYFIHAGTEKDADGNKKTTGGRVGGIVTQGDDLADAREMAYQEMEKIYFQDMFYRQDIGRE
jgi:phosphoribosylamine---glycine ligase